MRREGGVGIPAPKPIYDFDTTCRLPWENRINRILLKNESTQIRPDEDHFSTWSRALSSCCFLCAVFSRMAFHRWFRFSSLLCRLEASSPALDSTRSLPTLLTVSTVALWANTSFWRTWGDKSIQKWWDVGRMELKHKGTKINLLKLHFGMKGDKSAASSFCFRGLNETWSVVDFCRTWCLASSISMALGSPPAFLCSLSSSSVWLIQASSSSSACWNWPSARRPPSSLCWINDRLNH